MEGAKTGGAKRAVAEGVKFFLYVIGIGTVLSIGIALVLFYL